MKNLRESLPEGLVWMQPQALVRAYELKAGEEVVGNLQWIKSTGSLADAVAADGHWTFKRIGFFSPRISVRVHGQDTDSAVFQPQWTGGGMLEFPSGPRLAWGSSGFWPSRWLFRNASGEPLVEYEPCDSLLKRAAAVKGTPAGLAMAELSLLVLLGWYLMLLEADDGGAVAASVACIGAAVA